MQVLSLGSITGPDRLVVPMSHLPPRIVSLPLLNAVLVADVGTGLVPCTSSSGTAELSWCGLFPSGLRQLQLKNCDWRGAAAGQGLGGDDDERNGERPSDTAGMVAAASLFPILFELRFTLGRRGDHPEAGLPAPFGALTGLRHLSILELQVGGGCG